MRRRLQKYVSLRGETYQLRLPIPKDLQSRVGRREFRWSIGTMEKTIAKRRGLEGTLAFVHFCDRLRRMPEMTQDTITALARELYEELCQTWRPCGPKQPGDVGRWLEEQDFYTEEAIAGFKDAIETRQHSGEDFSEAARRAFQHGVDWDALSPLEQLQVLEALSRARIEFFQFTRFRTTSLVEPYEPSDPILATSGTVQSIANSVSGQVPTYDGISVGEAVEKFLAAGMQMGISGQGPWKPATLRYPQSALKWFIDLVGVERPVKSITVDDVRKFRDGCAQLRKRVPRSEHFCKAQTEKAELRVDPKTAHGVFAWLKTFLNWLEAEGYISQVPGQSLKIPAPAKPMSQARRSFTKAEIEMLLKSPLFSGSKSKAARHIPGAYKSKDDDFWIPLVLLMTGARLNEIVDLKAGSAKVDGEEVSHFDLSFANQELKTHSSERKIPIHPLLLEVGFADFVAKRQAHGKKEFLFSGIKTEGKRSNYYSKKLGRYLKRIGLNDPQIVTHSFRHSFKDILRDAQVPDDAINRLTGHSDGSVASKYGSGASLTTLKEHLEGSDFGVTLEIRKILLS